jgi:hypothetical protein
MVTERLIAKSYTVPLCVDWKIKEDCNDANRRMEGVQLSKSKGASLILEAWPMKREKLSLVILL